MAYTRVMIYTKQSNDNDFDKKQFGLKVQARIVSRIEEEKKVLLIFVQISS